MLFKNAFKLMLSKFPLVWSVLLYGLICACVVGGLGALVWIPAIGQVNQVGLFTEMQEVCRELITGGSSFGGFLTRFSETFGQIIDKLSSNTFQVVSTVVLLLVVARLAFGMMELPLTKCLEGQMSSNAVYGFTASYLSHIGKSTVYQLSKLLFTLPFDVATIFLMYGTSKLMWGGVSWLIPMAMILEFVLLGSFKDLLFCTWAPYLAVDKTRIFTGMRRGVKLGFARGAKIYSLQIATRLLSIAFNVFVGIFTFGVGLLFSLPVTYLFDSTLKMAIFYTYTGKRYYIDATTVFTPPITDANQT